MRAPHTGDRVRVGSIRRRNLAPPVGFVEALDCYDRPGVLVRFVDLVNGIDHCYATYSELELVRGE